jgi:ribosome maturation factor RimP
VVTVLSAREKSELIEQISKIVSNRGFYFVDLEERFEKGSHVISVVIHREPSVTIADCERITWAILPVLQSQLWFTDDYQLEVTSPGLDRTLRREDEYEIFKGRKADVTFENEDKVETLRVTLMGKEDGSAVVEAEGNYYRIPFDRIRKAKLVFEEGGEKHGKKQKRSHRKSS